MELTRWLVASVLALTLAACSGEVTSRGSDGIGWGGASSEAGAASHAGTGGTSGAGAGHGSSGGGGAGAPFQWDHKCKCKNWTDPSNYPTDMLWKNGCVAGAPCEDGLVCCAISCVAPFPGVCDWLGPGSCRIGEHNPPDYLCCAMFPDDLTACVKPDLCADDGVLQRRDPPKAGDKIFRMCEPE